MTAARPENAAARTKRQQWKASREARREQRELRSARQAKLARRYETLKRVPHASADPTLVDVDTGKFRPRFIKQALRIFPGDSDLYDFIDMQVLSTKKKAGRPTHLETRTVCILLWLHVVVAKEFFILDAMTSVLGRMKNGMLRDLGVDRDRRGNPTPLTYDKLIDAFHRIADAFDPFAEGLTDVERRRRDDARVELLNRLCAMSLLGAPVWRGNGAIDATYKSAWERPPSPESKDKFDGKDGQKGTPLNKILGDLDPNEAFTDFDVINVVNNLEERPRKKRRWGKTWGRGSTWVGRAKAHKSIYGVGLTTVTSTDEGAPAVVVALDVHAAKANPAQAGYRLLSRLHDERMLDTAVVAEVDAGCAQILGDISSDPAYGMLPEHWQLRLRDLGANCLYRLHSQNQAGTRSVAVGRKTTREDVPLEDGAPVCACTPPALRGRKFPHYPSSRNRTAAYAKVTLALDPWRWKPSSSWRPVMTRDKTTGAMVQKRNADGRPLYEREYRAPHGAKRADGTRGGCAFCVHADGTPVVDDAGRPKPRCCTIASHIFPDTALPAIQEPSMGTPGWFAIMHAHNRVEATFGIAKNLAILNWGRQYHHFVGVTREGLVAAFVIMAYNFHIIRTWRYRQKLTAEPEPFDPFAAADAADDSAADIDEMRPATTRRRAAATKTQRGPKGLEGLGPPSTAG